MASRVSRNQRSVSGSLHYHQGVSENPHHLCKYRTWACKGSQNQKQGICTGELGCVGMFRPSGIVDPNYVSNYVMDIAKRCGFQHAPNMPT